MILRFIENIGDKTLSFLSSLYEAFAFTYLCTTHLLRRSSYNPAMRKVLVKQIYFTAITLIPSFIIMAIIFGSIIIGVVISKATEFGLEANIGSIIITFIINEFAPFFTALLVALRSGTAVTTEMAIMSVNREINTLKEYKIDLIDYLFLPRIISGVISVTTLTILFSVVMLMSGYIFILFYMGMDFHTYKLLLLNAIEIKSIAILLIKSAIFGFVVMLVPIYSGISTGKSYNDIPLAVLNGMVKLFISLFFVEVFSLLIQSL